MRNKITWLSTKSGEIKLTTYSADRIHFDGQPCVLAVSEDIPQLDLQGRCQYGSDFFKS